MTDTKKAMQRKVLGFPPRVPWITIRRGLNRLPRVVNMQTGRFQGGQEFQFWESAVCLHADSGNIKALEAFVWEHKVCPCLFLSSAAKEGKQLSLYFFPYVQFLIYL